MAQKGFEKYELPQRVMEQLDILGFRYPTKVQEKVIPLFKQKLNLIVEAPTGTGKTAAYGLPLISMLNLAKRSTQALVLAPSRELAIQISSALQSYFLGDQLKIATVFGGVPVSESFQEIKKGAHILVAVPGRLRDVMSQYQYDYLWRDIKFFIIDEGDKLLETGFQRDFDVLRTHIRNTAQIGFFSATISADSEALIRSRVPHIRTVRLSPKEMLSHIRFEYVRVEKGQGELYLASLLAELRSEKALIFCGRREEILSVTGFLRNRGQRAEAYYGAQDQVERANILLRFKEDKIHFLVASDLAARGLDIADLPMVINLSIPEEFDYYLHRVGRTGRAGNKGNVYNIISSDKEEVFMKNHHTTIGIPIRRRNLSPKSAEALTATPEEKWVKFHISRGKKDKIRKMDIVGFLIHQAELAADEIGTITIYDTYSTVNMPMYGFEKLAEVEEGLKIKGKAVKIRKFLTEEQERKAQSIKNLLKDRKKV